MLVVRWSSAIAVDMRSCYAIVRVAPAAAIPSGRRTTIRSTRIVTARIGVTHPICTADRTALHMSVPLAEAAPLVHIARAAATVSTPGARLTSAAAGAGLPIAISAAGTAVLIRAAITLSGAGHSTPSNGSVNGLTHFILFSTI